MMSHGLAALAILACKDDGPCLAYPCPLFEAVTVTVSAANSTSPPSGVAVVVSEVPGQTVPCDAQAVCHVYGGPGKYDLTVNAPGFNPQQIQVTVAGEPAGCNSCGRLDRQQIAVTLSPATRASRQA